MTHSDAAQLPEANSPGCDLRSVPGRDLRHPHWAQVPDADWNDWRWQMKHRVSRPQALAELLELSDDEVRGIAARSCEFPVAVTPYYLSLMAGPQCPVRRQAIPTIQETVADPSDMVDPLAEEEHSPVQIVSHRYRDRALLYVTHNCPVYCRHCTRQRKVGDAHSAPSLEDIDAAIDYIARHPEIRDVLVSGGDPLSLSDRRLVDLVSRLRAIESVEIIRLCTRNPVTLPQRITPELVQALRPYHPIFVNTHFNHPRECTPAAAAALARLADAGFAVGNQSVLLKGINDNAETMIELNRWLLRQRCRPYYMFQCDPVAGTAHLRTPVQTGRDIIDRMRGRVSGLAIPHFAVDLPGGGGKITLTPNRELAHDASSTTFADHRGDPYTYFEAGSPASTGETSDVAGLANAGSHAQAATKAPATELRTGTRAGRAEQGA